MTISNTSFLKERVIYFFLLILVFLTIPLEIHSQSQQDVGLPFITNFSPKDYHFHPQNWDIIQDDKGIMYFANSQGLLEYDGVKWNAIIDNRLAVIRSMDIDDDNRIFIGSSSELGYYMKDEFGKWAYTSFVEYLPEHNRNFNDIWTVHYSEQGIYFQAREYIFLFSENKTDQGITWTVKVWEPTDDFLYSFYLDRNYFVHQRGTGLMKMVGDELKFIPGTEMLGNDRLNVMLPFHNSSDTPEKDRKYLLGQFRNGFFTLQGETVKPFISKINEISKSYFVYKGIKTNDDQFIVSAIGKGIIKIDKKGNIIQELDKSLGLFDNSTYCFFIDKNESLWMGMDNGISRIELSSPLSFFGESYGINTSILSLKRHDGTLYLGTTNGLFHHNIENNKFEQNQNIPFNQVFDLVVVDEDLLITSDGLFGIRDDIAYTIMPSVAGEFQASSVFHSSINQDYIFSGLQNGLAIFKKHPDMPSPDKSWQYLGKVPGVTENIWKFAETSDGTIWAGTQNNKIIAISNLNYDDTDEIFENIKISLFDESSGLPNGPSTPLTFKGDLLAATPNGIYQFEPENNRFIIDTSLISQFSGMALGGDPTEYTFVSDHLNRIWFNFGEESGLLTETGNGKHEIVTTPFLSFSDNAAIDIFPENNGITWFATFDGLIRYDEKVNKTYHTSFATFIREVHSSEKQLNLSPEKMEQGLKLAFAENSLQFQFSAPYFEQENKTTYQTYLEGFDKTWSGWHEIAQKEYTNLPYGKYVFRARAKNIYNQISEEAEYHFRVLPPWYQTWWSYLVYALLGGSLVYLFSRWRVSQHLEKSRQLEIEVAERTKEIQDRIEQLSVINSVQQGLVEKMDIDSIYTLVGDQICKLLGADTLVIRSFNQEKQIEVINYAVEKGKKLIIPDRPFDSFSKFMLEHREPILIKSNFRQFIQQFGEDESLEGEIPKSAIFSPMFVNNQIIGNVSLQSVEYENAFNENDVKIMGTLINSMSVALENARLFDESNQLLAETQQRNNELAVINSIQEGLVAQIDMQGIYDLVGDQIRDIFNAQVVQVSNFNLENSLEEFPYLFEKGKRLYPKARPIDPMRKKIIEEKETIVINQDTRAYVKNNFGVDPKPVPGSEWPKSVAFVPMIVGDQVKACISLQNIDHENAFSDSDISLLNTLANSMSIALENARLFDQANQLLQEAEIRAEELAVINRIQEGLVKQVGLQEIFEFVGDSLQEIVDAQTIVISSFDHDKEMEIFNYATRGGKSFDIENRDFDNFTRQIIEQPKALVINYNFKEYIEQYISQNEKHWDFPKSAVFVPITSSGKVVGNISLQHLEKENAYSHSDVTLLETLVLSISVALDNARLFEETQQRAAEMGTVNSVSQAINKKLELEQLIQLAGDSMRDLFKANVVYVALLNKEENILDFPYGFGDDFPPMKYGEGLTSAIIKSGEPQLINEDVDSKYDELGIKNIGVKSASYLGVPIPIMDEVIGVISVQSTEKANRFNESDMHLLTTIASNVGVAIYNAKLFEEAETSRAMAEEANEAKSAFLSTVSHELRTPLTSVLGFAKIIKKRLEEKVFPEIKTGNPRIQKTVKQVSENLGVVISEGQRLTKLINDVLDLAKIEAGKIDWNIEPICLDKVADRAIAATTSLFEEKKLKLIKHIGEDIPRIQGDKDKLIQVIVNLLSNAVKFTDEGIIECKLWAENTDLIFSVGDKGIGISEEDLPRVFEKFKQVGDTLTDKPKGTGLGLPICKEIIEYHKGKIWARSVLGVGSTFYFSIPIG